MAKRRVRTLEEWFSLDPRPMSKYRFAKELGITPSYVTRLCKTHNPPWPGRPLARKIGEVTRGFVTANDLCGLEVAEAPDKVMGSETSC